MVPFITRIYPRKSRQSASLLACLLFLAAPDSSRLRAQEEGNSGSVGPRPPVGVATDQSEKALSALDILPVGEESHGVVLPDYDLQGNLLSMLKAKSATRINETEITLEAMTLTLSQEPPRSKMLVDLPKARYDLKTSMLFGLRNVKISRDDFILTGDILEFDTKTRRGVVRGNVEMILKNRPSPAPVPAPEFTPTSATRQ